MGDPDLAHAADSPGDLKRTQIEATPLFQDLDARSLAQLAFESEIVAVSRGDVIMDEGGDSDCFYVIVQGSLEVFLARAGGTRVLDVLGDGASVGEMGVLTREPRTVSVRARRDSTLLRVPAAVFETVLQENAHVTLRLARTLSDRLKRTTSAAERPAPRTSIALLRACDETLFDEFCRRLTEAFERAGHRVALASPSALGLDVREPASSAEQAASETDERLAAIVAAFERAHDYVLCASDLHAPGWSRWSIRQADSCSLSGG